MQQKLLIIAIICLKTPFLVTCFSYLVIWRKRRKSTVRSFRQNQEAWFSWTIFLVTAASFITWMPFLYYDIAVTVRSDPIEWSGIFFLSSFNILTHLSILLSTFLCFLVTERLCFLYVDSTVTCKSTHQFETLTPTILLVNGEPLGSEKVKCPEKRGRLCMEGVGQSKIYKCHECSYGS